jgi:hypothetical protein
MDTIYLSHFEHAYRQLAESGKAPWLREGVIERVPAYNPYSGVQYRGVNGVMLDMSAASRDFHDPRWISLHEAAHIGLTLRRGERPVPAAYTSAGSQVNYYLLCNLEQFKEYPRMPERNVEAEREIGKEKLRAALEHSGAAGFTGVLDRVEKEASQGQGGNSLAVVLARYRISQECNEYYAPPANAGALQREESGRNRALLIKAVYRAETAKDRLITRNRDDRDNPAVIDRTPVREF